MKKYIFGVWILLNSLFFNIGQANAMYFSDYLYQSVRAGRLSGVQKYLHQGLNVDAINPNGKTALCQSVDAKDYSAYMQIRQLGANVKHKCMRLVNNHVATNFDKKYSVTFKTSSSSVISEGSNKTAYMAVGVLAAAGVGVALGGSGGGGSGGDDMPEVPEVCPDGKKWSDEELKCVPIVCGEDEALVGNDCISKNCLTGEVWSDEELKCVPIVCGEDEVLVGNDCVARCTEDMVWNGSECEARCADGMVWNGSECVARCSDDMVWNGSECEVRCSDDMVWDGSECVARCAEDQEWNGSECIARCSDDMVWDGSECVARCSDDMVWNGSECEARCAEDQEWNGSECAARCSDDVVWNGSECVARCADDMVWNGSECEARCADDMVWNGSECEARCADDMVWNGSECEARCAEDQEWNGSECVARCAEDMVWNGSECVARCTEDKEWNGSECVARCTEDKEWNGSECVARCTEDKEWNGSECIARCSDDMVWDGSECVARCTEDKEWNGSECVARCTEDKEWNGTECVARCSDDMVWDGSECVARCTEDKEWNGSECVSRCAVGEKWKKDEGRCVPIICPEGTILKGNSCIIQDDINKEAENDETLYGVSADDDVYNLFSTPGNPDNENNITLTQKGDGDVRGIYGKANVLNAYVVGKSNDGSVTNPQDTGHGNINITSEGTGTVYGLYTQIEDITQYLESINAEAWNSGTAYGNIDITHNGTGESYGVFGDIRAYNTLSGYSVLPENDEYLGTAYGDITIRGHGNIYGVSGYVIASNATSAYGGNTVGNINLYQMGNADVYGLKVNKDAIPGAGAGGRGTGSWAAFNAIAQSNGSAKGVINIRNYGNGTAYGMYGGESLYNTLVQFGGREAQGTINVLSAGNGDAYGMYLPDAATRDEYGRIRDIVSNRNSSYEKSVINIINNGNGTAIGMRGGEGVVIQNSGEININNLGDGTAIGIYGEKSATITNTGTINIYRQEYTDEETGEVYAPKSEIGGTAYGIYAETGAKVMNYRDIVITGAGSGEGIHLEEGATLVNNGRVLFNGENQSPVTTASLKRVINFNDIGGDIILGKNGKFFATEFQGDLNVSDQVVLGSLDDVYTVDGALQAEQVDDLRLASQSVLFNADKKANKSGGYDVILSRKDFSNALSNVNLGQFYEDNYKQGNNVGLFDELKRAKTNNELSKTAANLAGTDVLPSFRRENALVYRHLSRQFNDSLFNKPDENYFGGYMYINISNDEKGTIVESDGKASAAYGMLKGKGDNGLVYGVGATVTHLESDYDTNSSRKSNSVGLWVPVGYEFGNGAKWYSKLYAGYANGDYKRITRLGKYTADLEEYQYGLTNEARYKIHLKNGFNVEPVAELNLLGIYQNGFNEGEKEYALQVKSGNSLSLEGGLGAYLSKDFIFDENSKLGIQIGGVYYVEFLDPDDGYNAAMNGMSGRYKLKNKFRDNYAVLSFRANYTYKDLMLYAALAQETNGSDAFTVDAGLQYKF